VKVDFWQGVTCGHIWNTGKLCVRYAENALFFIFLQKVTEQPRPAGIELRLTA
jgi:hypothetical protein